MPTIKHPDRFLYTRLAPWTWREIEQIKKKLRLRTYRAVIEKVIADKLRAINEDSDGAR